LSTTSIRHRFAYCFCGGISRVIYDPNLKGEERSKVLGSINYDKATENWAAGFTLEALHQTERRICFRKYWRRIGQVFEKQNGFNAIVQGITIEFANFNRNFS
jgi:outer membrane receptor for ferrienterochelin and colicins